MKKSTKASNIFKRLIPERFTKIVKSASQPSPIKKSGGIATNPWRNKSLRKEPIKSTPDRNDLTCGIFNKTFDVKSKLNMHKKKIH